MKLAVPLEHPVVLQLQQPRLSQLLVIFTLLCHMLIIQLSDIVRTLWSRLGTYQSFPHCEPLEHHLRHQALSTHATNKLEPQDLELTSKCTDIQHSLHHELSLIKPIKSSGSWKPFN